MSLAIQRAAFFIADFEIQFAWYVEKAGAEVAWRFQSALDDSLRKLSVRSDLGRIRHFRSPKLRGLRSYRVERPFKKLLISIVSRAIASKQSVSCMAPATCPVA